MGENRVFTNKLLAAHWTGLWTLMIQPFKSFNLLRCITDILPVIFKWFTILAGHWHLISYNPNTPCLHSFLKSSTTIQILALSANCVSMNKLQHLHFLVILKGEVLKSRFLMWKQAITKTKRRLSSASSTRKHISLDFRAPKNKTCNFHNYQHQLNIHY